MLRPTEAFAQSIILERVLPARRGRESAVVHVPKQSILTLMCFLMICTGNAVLHFGSLAPFIFLWMFCLGWQILARAQCVVLLLHPLATQAVGLQKVQLDVQDANAVLQKMILP